MLRDNYGVENIHEFIGINLDDSLPIEILDVFREIYSIKAISTEDKIKFIDKLTQLDHLSFIITRTKKKDVGRSIPRNAKSFIVDINPQEQNYYDAVIEFIKFLNPQIPSGFITIMPERMASSSMMASLESFKSMKKSGKLFIKDIDDLEDYYEDFDIKKEAMKLLDNVIEAGDLIGEYDSKFLRFEEILQDIKSQRIEQLVVFSFFKKTLDYLEKKLLERNYRVGKIHGDFGVEERFGIIKNFKNKKFDILLSSEVGSEGLDMQFCNVVINYDLPWNPMRVEQRIGRIDRIGQKYDQLHIFNLCIKNSIEDRIYNRLYEKLDIFERSIGELEPILGNLELNLNVKDLIYLSQKEIDKKMNLQELAIKREELELSHQVSEVEKLINDDITYQAKEDKLINLFKIKSMQTQCENIFIDFLEQNDISYNKLKDGIVKLSAESTKKIFSLLRSLMSDRKINGYAYKNEYHIMQKINRLKELKISFETNNNEEYQTLHLFPNHPIMLMLTRDKFSKFVISRAVSKCIDNGYAVIYRADIKHSKLKSYIKTILLDSKLQKASELDYFEFIRSCEQSHDLSGFDANKIKSIATTFVIVDLENEKAIENGFQNRLIDSKISSIQSYFNKKISKIQNSQVAQEDIKRMRIGEVDNLAQQRDKKIFELNQKRMMQSNFEILGIVEISND